MISLVDTLFAVPFAALVLYVARTDLARFEIPDWSVGALLVLGLAWIAASSFSLGEDLLSAAIRAVAAAAFLYVVRTAYRALRKAEGLGLGDVKLAGAGAVWLTWPQMPIALLVAASAAVLMVAMQSVLQRRTPLMQAVLPFGAFLAPAIWLVWIAGLYDLF